jgi:DNA-binding MarR family transcriptional regulator
VRPSPASRGLVRVGPDFDQEFPDGDARSTEIIASTVRVGAAVLAELDRTIYASFGVAQPVITALAVIEGADGPLTPSEISERMLVASATMTATLDTLESRGWVARTPNPADRRSVLVTITDEGRATADQFLPGIRKVELALASKLTGKERDQLLTLMGKLLEGAAETAEHPPIPLEGRRKRPKRPT